MSNTLYGKWTEDSVLKEIGGCKFTPDALKFYQLKKIRQTIGIAKKIDFMEIY